MADYTQPPSNTDEQVEKAKSFVVKHKTKILAVVSIALFLANRDLKRDKRHLRKELKQTQQVVAALLSDNKEAAALSRKAVADLDETMSIFDKYFSPRMRQGA